MKRTRAVLVVSIVLGVVASPLLVGAQTSNARVGVLSGSIPADATVGVMAGALPPNATVGVVRGAIPADATVGVLAGSLPPNATVGVLAGSLPPNATVGVLAGSLPPNATVGTLSPGLAPGVGLGEPLPADVAGRLNQLADTHLTDAAFLNAEPALRRSVTVRKDELGPDHPEVARTLESHAAKLQSKNREAAASEMAAEAKAIRTRLEQQRQAE